MRGRGLCQKGRLVGSSLNRSPRNLTDRFKFEPRFRPEEFDPFNTEYCLRASEKRCSDRWQRTSQPDNIFITTIVSRDPPAY